MPQLKTLYFTNLTKGYRRLFRRNIFEFIRKEKEVDDTYSFYLKPLKSFKFKAGQHIILTVPHENPDDRGESRYFSISSAPFEQYIRISMRFFGTQSSTFKKALFNLEPGIPLQAQGPFGNFIVTNPKRAHVFLAGGIGVTPFRSILLDLDHKKLPIKAEMLYANSDENIVFTNELEGLETQHVGFDVHYFRGDRRLVKEDIVEHAGKLHNPIYFISGSPSFIETFRGYLKEIGVNSKNIRFERFKAYQGGGYQ